MSGVQVGSRSRRSTVCSTLQHQGLHIEWNCYSSSLKEYNERLQKFRTELEIKLMMKIKETFCESLYLLYIQVYPVLRFHSIRILPKTALCPSSHALSWRTAKRKPPLWPHIQSFSPDFGTTAPHHRRTIMFCAQRWWQCRRCRQCRRWRQCSRWQQCSRRQAAGKTPLSSTYSLYSPEAAVRWASA